MKKSASVAIIGGGIIGASIGYNLAMNGLTDVVILDKSKAGAGSTSASLGGFRHQFSSELSIRLSQRSTRIIERFEDLTGYDPIVSRDGYVFIASTEASFAQLKKNRDLQRELGVPIQLLSREELQEGYPFYRFEEILGGTFCQEDGHASTMAVFQGYMSRAKQLGVELYENTEVSGVEHGTDGFHLKTPSGSLVAGSVIIAAGAYSGLVGNLVPVKIPIKPYPRKILVTNSFTDGIPPRIPLIIDVDSTFAFGREGRGLIFANNREMASSFELVFPSDYDDNVIKTAVRRVPATKHSSLSYANSGLYELTPDSNPIVCEMPNVRGLYCCSGFAGHGFMHAPAIGELMAELITKGKTSLDISSYSIDRFEKGSTEKEGLII
ncbi:MAG TPA: FAD-binding oxidoreductase [Nitrososphaerales archaeon]|nr:FAD-binding oxidoreductase [Nitrososphaerales archaeon]